MGRTCKYPVCNQRMAKSPAIHPNPIAVRPVTASSEEAAPVLLGVGEWRLDVVLATAPPPAAPVRVVVDVVEVEVRERPAVFEGVCEEPDVSWPPPVRVDRVEVEVAVGRPTVPPGDEMS
jgi:hypothetical protein